MIATLIACDHAEVRDPRLLGSLRASPARETSGRRGPLSSLLARSPHGPASALGEQQGECAHTSPAQAATSPEGLGL